MLSKEAEMGLVGLEPVNSRIIKAKFRTSNFMNLNVIMRYALTNEADDDNEEEFYTILQTVMLDKREREMVILMGDINVKVV